MAGVVRAGRPRSGLPVGYLQSCRRNDRALDVLFVERDTDAPGFLRREVQEARAIEPVAVGSGRCYDLQGFALGCRQDGGGSRGLLGGVFGVESAELDAPALPG